MASNYLLPGTIMKPCRWRLLAIMPKLYFFIKLTLRSSPLCHSYRFCPIMQVLPQYPLTVPPNVAVMAFLWNLYKRSRFPGSLMECRTLVSCHVRWELFWEKCEVRHFKVKHLFGLKTPHWRLSRLPPCPPPHHSPFPVSVTYVCLAWMLLCADLLFPPSFLPVLCLSGASLNHFFSHFDSSSVKRKLLQIMTPAEESRTMTYDSNIKEQLRTSSFIYVAYLTAWMHHFARKWHICPKCP